MSEDAQDVTTDETDVAADAVAEEAPAEEPVADAAPEADAVDEPVAEAAPADEAPADDAPATDDAPAEEPVAEAEPAAEEPTVDDAPADDDVVVDEPVADEAPAEVAEAFGPVRVARVYVCEKGHRTTTLWGEPDVCQAQPLRHGAHCGMKLYHITELPEQVQKALNPLKASKKASKKK